MIHSFDNDKDVITSAKNDVIWWYRSEDKFGIEISTFNTVVRVSETHEKY